MTNKNIINVLNILAMSVYYITSLLVVLLLAWWVYCVATGHTGLNDSPLTYDVTSFRNINSPARDVYSTDSTLIYTPVQNKYKVKISALSPLGYYAFAVFLAFAAIGLSILKGFMNIFKEIKLERPFTAKLVSLLKRLVLLFIAADLLQIINYFIFGQFMHSKVPAYGFSLNTEIGANFVTGLIIWVIAVIYQRGVELQTESDLTV